MSAYAAVHRDLVNRGMLHPETGRLTAAGLDYSGQILRDLRGAVAVEGSGRSVRWNTRRDRGSGK